MGTTAYYEQSTGNLILPGGRVIKAGSGYRNSKGRFQPDAQFVKNYGPVPVGTYNLGTPQIHRYNLKTPKGQKQRYDETMSIFMDPQNPGAMGGRARFWIHHPHASNKQSSGCMVMSDQDVALLVQLRREGKLTQIKVVRGPGKDYTHDMKQDFDPPAGQRLKDPPKLKDLKQPKDKTRKYREKLNKTNDGPTPNLSTARQKPWYKSKYTLPKDVTGVEPKKIKWKKKKKKKLQHKQKMKVQAHKQVHKKQRIKQHRRKKRRYRIKHPKAFRHTPVPYRKPHGLSVGR